MVREKNSMFLFSYMDTGSNLLHKQMDDFVNGYTKAHNMPFLRAPETNCLKPRTKNPGNKRQIFAAMTPVDLVPCVRWSLWERPHRSAADRPNHWSSWRRSKQDPFSMWTNQFLIALLRIIWTWNVMIWTLAVYYRIKAIGPLDTKDGPWKAGDHVRSYFGTDSQPLAITSLHMNLKKSLFTDSPPRPALKSIVRFDGCRWNSPTTSHTSRSLLFGSARLATSSLARKRGYWHEGYWYWGGLWTLLKKYTSQETLWLQVILVSK